MLSGLRWLLLRSSCLSWLRSIGRKRLICLAFGFRRVRLDCEFRSLIRCYCIMLILFWVCRDSEDLPADARDQVLPKEIGELTKLTFM